MPKIGRNAPCPCGSGKKYKKCCINKDKLAIEPAHLQDEDADFHDDMEDIIGELLEDFESAFSPEELKLYDAFDEIEELTDDENRIHEAARKFLEATGHIQDIPDDFPWDMGGVAEVLLEDLRMDDPKLAIEVMRRAVVLDPVNASSWKLDMAEIMTESGEADKGFAVLHRLAEEAPDNIKCWIALGKSYLGTKDYENAKEHLQHAIGVGEAQKEDSQIAWDIGDAYAYLFDVYRETDLVEEAIQVWQESDDCVDVSQVCDMLIKKGDVKRVQEFAGMIENSMKRNYQLGRIRFLQGNEKEGLRHWDAVLSEASSDMPITWPEVALRLCRHDLLIKLLPDFLDLIPRSVPSRVLLSLAHVMDSDMELAQRVLRDAPRKVELPDELRQLCAELPLDEQSRVQWLEMFSSD
ncbi:SEC-C metal-binding domain-containing protein [Candidatus Poribacteria bacterium]